MHTTQRKVGRPKSPPRSGPLVLGEDQGRTKVSFEISDRAAGELAEYTQWVEECSGMTASQARFKTIDFALREVFRRDRVWQSKRRKAPQPEPIVSAPTVTTGPAARPVASPPPSLPPPAPRDPRVSGGTEPGGSRV